MNESLHESRTAFICHFQNNRQITQATQKLFGGILVPNRYKGGNYESPNTEEDRLKNSSEIDRIRPQRFHISSFENIVTHRLPKLITKWKEKITIRQR